MLMEERREVERSGEEERGRRKGNETSEPEGRDGHTEREREREEKERRSRQRNILAGYMQYELLPKNIKNLLADGQWRLNTNHGPRARRIASWIIGLYCCTYKVVYVAMFRISLDLDIVIRISRVWLMDRFASFLVVRCPAIPIESRSRFFSPFFIFFFFPFPKERISHFGKHRPGIGY